MNVYREDFARIYNDHWGRFAHNIWPFLLDTVTKKNPGATTWLDLCCGTGITLRQACESGFAATGVDLSQHQLKHARKNAPQAKLVKSDVRRFSLPRKFDVVTCMFDSLNYLTRKSELAGVFRRVKRHLEPGGLFIFDMNVYPGYQAVWNRTSVLDEPGFTLVFSTSFDERKSQGQAKFTGFVKEGRRYRKFEEEHIQRAWRGEEIDTLLDRAGLSFSARDGHTLNRPKKKSGRLVYICQRKASRK
jgi:SAM-dependent methyltransferase